MSPKIAVVIPAYRCKSHILAVLSAIGASVHKIYVVDDCCPEKTGEFVSLKSQDPRVEVLTHKVNLGVGGAVLTGYQMAIQNGYEIGVKVDGDGQMDPKLIPHFIQPLIAGEADYAKGNRFSRLSYLDQMPHLRIFGNAVLSFFSKLSSGYWNVFDPTNGYTAMRLAVLQQIEIEKIEKRFFFESDLLFRLYLAQAVVVDVPMKAVYGDEKSNLNELKIIPSFIWGHLRNFGKRVVYNYFLRDFNLASLQLFFGLPLFVFGLLYGLYHWYLSYSTQESAALGVIMLSALTFLVGLQFILGFFNHDITNIPRNPIFKRL